MGKVLIACEESQRVCIEFRNRGHEAYSCDLIDCSGEHPEWHIKSDCLPLLNGNCSFMTCDQTIHHIDGKWDLIIAHPPCTDLAVSGARHFEKKRADGRQRKGIEFFCAFFDADCDHVVIENPIGIISGDYIREYYPDIAYKYLLPKKPTQIIHPWMFGDNTVKSTCLWIKGLPALIPEVTTKPEIDYKEWVDAYGNTKRQAKWYIDALKLKGDERSKARSKTFPGIARAFAEQWSKCL